MTLKPAPEAVAELIVTGDVPVEVSVNDCVCAELTVTLPKLRFAVFADKSAPFEPLPCICIWPRGAEFGSSIVTWPE